MGKWAWSKIDPNVNFESFRAEMNVRMKQLEGVVNEKQRLEGVDVRDFGAFPGNSDATLGLQKAFKAMGDITGAELWFPDGTFLISDRILDQTSASRLCVRGPGHRRTIIKASPDLTDTQMIRVGNNTGHGVLQFMIDGVGFDGGDKTQNNTALMLHEGGLSRVSNFAAENCGTAIESPGGIAVSIEGRNYIASCTNGINFSRPTTGTPADAFDTTTTSAALSMSTNVSKIEGVWFTSIDEEVIHAEGGLFQLRNLVIQSCGASVDNDLVTFQDCNESFDYGGGPLLDAVWIEGGTYRYAIASRDTRGGSMRNVFISGSSTNAADNLPKEGGILLGGNVHGSSNWEIDQSTAIRGFFVATPTESRLANGALYVTPLSKNYKSHLRPYTVKSQVKVYFEGVASPTQTKAQKPHWACITISAGVATITAASSDFINSFTRNAAGDWTVTYKINRDNVAAGHYPTVVTVHTGSATKAYGVAIFGNQGASNERIIFKTTADVQEDPFGFTVFMYGEINTV